MSPDRTTPLALQWNQLTLEAIRCSTNSPPLAALVHRAIYDAWSVYDECAVSISTAQHIKTMDYSYCATENKRKAISFVACLLLKDCFDFRCPQKGQILKKM